MKTLEEEVARAGEAQQLLDSRVFQDASAFIEQGLAEQRRRAGVRDTDMHTKLILTEQLWGNLKDYFLQIAQTGQLAKFQIEEERRKRSIFSSR